VYLITPTGGRPEGLRLLANYLNAQTYAGPMVWIVVDDCDPETPLPPVRAGITIDHVRPAWRWQPGQNTQARCLAAALALVPADGRVLVLEDDDCYLPQHVELLADALQDADLVGEAPSVYYNVAVRRWRNMGNSAHASLCATGMKGAALTLFGTLCSINARRLDMTLWRDYRGPRRLLPQSQVVGIKGMPGRAGIGVGHRDDMGEPDPCGDTLRELIGADRAMEYCWFRRPPVGHAAAG
jgi:hypothetical protein